MTKPVRGRTRERRDEVARRLTALGLGSAKRFPQPAGTAEETLGLRLRAALSELGPVFTAFGRYLSSRADLLPENECLILAGLPDQRSPLSLESVRELLQLGLGQPPEQLYAAFDPAPAGATLVWQEHRARLAGGEPVAVRFVRPELAAELDRDLDLLPLLGPALAPMVQAGSGSWLAAAVDDFAAAMAAAADLGGQAAALTAVRQDGASSGLRLVVPRVLPALSTPRVLTREELPGTALETFFPIDAGTPGGPWSADLAVRLCQVWLRQACFGRAFPVDLEAGDVRVLPGDRLAWTGGTFGDLPPTARESLWEYLLAAAAHDPERACAALVREMEGGPADGQGLPERLRQLVPFRDGGWAARDDLAGYLFLHWRCATAMGYRPRPHLVLFYRGVARLAATARRLAPGRDALREGLEATRFANGLGDVARMFESDAMKQALGTYAAAMIAMPQRLNELLTLAAEGRTSIKLEMVEPPAERRRRDSSTAALAAVLAMVAVILIAHHLAGTLGSWAERIAAVLLGALGVFLLRALSRREP
ncbi:MAG TPA: AarF/UbiB family protein [Thermoanaerobaculia bacterium]|jgi:ubiquinone biosynthesis protein|nr:AarF/UbiB family protein [Thermoanaerobaculia bacterium]